MALRSRSDLPPHIPNRSFLTTANSRHSSITLHSLQIALAITVLLPLSGKNSSWSVPIQLASLYQSGICRISASVAIKLSLIAIYILKTLPIL
jgi:hypothetical protein